MATKITATELARNLSDVLNRVAYRAETFEIERNGETVATISPPAPPRGITLEEFVDELRKVPRPDDRFADDLAEIHAAQGVFEPDNWPDSYTRAS